MLTLLMHSRTAWSDYFTGSPTLIQSQTYRTQQKTSATNVHVSNCLFESITSGSNGGALFCSTSVTYLLVESSSFISCKTSDSNGGAIYFKNTNNGESVLYEVCGYDCYSTRTSSDGQFSYIYVNNGISSKNYVNYSSITRCVIDNSGSYYMLYHYYGNICCPSVNISMNKCYSRSGFYGCPFSDSNSVTCSLSYSSFADNVANWYGCIKLWTSGAKYEIKSCNILRNTQGSLDTYGIFRTYGNTMILDSCILENKANCIFFIDSYTVTLSNCTVDKTSSNGNLITQNTVIKSFIHALNHLSTRNCRSEYDFAGTLTPIAPPPPPSPSPSKNIILCFTYGNFFHHPPQVNFVSLSSVFIFNFIHTYPSTDYLY
jgi:hypothetical protein